MLVSGGTLSMQTSHKYLILKENMRRVFYGLGGWTCQKFVVAKQNGVRRLIYSQHGGRRSQICYSKENVVVSNLLSAGRQVTNMWYSQRKYVHIGWYTLSMESSHKYVIAKETGGHMVIWRLSMQKSNKCCNSKRTYVHI